MARGGKHEIDNLLSSLIDATKFGYVPLEYYDIDRAVVRMLPENLTLGRLIVPFDIVSRTMMIALCNPFRRRAPNRRCKARSIITSNGTWPKPNAILAHPAGRLTASMAGTEEGGRQKVEGRKTESEYSAVSSKKPASHQPDFSLLPLRPYAFYLLPASFQP